MEPPTVVDAGAAATPESAADHGPAATDARGAVVLLGPQRDTAGARAAVTEWAPHGPIAMINAGWTDREDQTAELGDVLGGRMVALKLYARHLMITEGDRPAVERQERLLRAMAETHDAYLIRLRHVLAAADELRRHEAHTEFGGSATIQVIMDLAELDRRHDVALDRLRAELAAEAAASTMISEHRAELAATLADATALVITGGHLGTLLHLAAAFDLAGPVRRSIVERGLPVITWSAGAMLTAERVMLFGEGITPDVPRLQAYGSGLGLHAGAVCFPHARTRLDLADHDDLARTTRRLAPRRGLLLDPGDVVVTGADGPVRGARWLSATGVVEAPRPVARPGGDRP